AEVVAAQVGAAGDGRGVLAAAGGRQVEERGRGRGESDADDAAEGRGAVEIGATAGGESNAGEGLLRDLVPVDPAAEGVAGRDVLLEDEGAAGRGGPESAERDALAG